jgi:thymidylate synthase
MFILTDCSDADDVLSRCCVLLDESPQYAPRGHTVKGIHDAVIEINNVDKCIVTNPIRKLDSVYLAAEMLWYLRGDLSAETIGKYAKIWVNIADESGNINSNYGHMVFHQRLPNSEGSQFSWVVKLFQWDKDTRQALMNYNQLKHKEEKIKDFPCTIATHYSIRDDELYSRTYMRSQDLIYGFCYDIVWFSFVHQLLWLRLKQMYSDLLLGPCIYHIADLHVYERHFDMIKNIADDYKTSVCSKVKSNRLGYFTSFASVYADIMQKSYDSNFMKGLLRNIDDKDA